MTKRRGVGDHEQFGHGLGELHIVVEVLLLMRGVVLRAQRVRASENVEGFGGVLRDGGAGREVSHGLCFRHCKFEQHFGPY